MTVKATTQQTDFIKDLILKKFGNFREFKKWLATTGIVRTNGQIFKQSLNLVSINNRITDVQATAMITEMEKLDDIKYKTAYDQSQVDEVNSVMAEVKKEVDSWTFAA